MKKIIAFLFILSLSFSNICFSQSGWFWQNPLPQGNNLLSVQFLNLNTGFAVGNAGCFMKTTNGGLNWNDKYFIGGYVPQALRSLFFLNEFTGFVGSTLACNKLLKTNNGGESWDTSVSSNGGGFTTIFFANLLTGWSCCSFEPGIIADDNILFKTTNGGDNWSIQNSTLKSIYSSFFINSNTGWLVGNYSHGYPINSSAFYIYRTTNSGDNWVTQLYFSDQQSLNTVFFVNENTGWAGGTKLWKTTNAGVTWNSQNIATNSISFISNQVGYVVSDSAIYKTTNTGNNWNLMNIVGGNCVSIQDTYNAYVVGRQGRLNRTTDGGYNWSILSNSVTDGYLYSIYFTNNLTGYAISNSGTIYNLTSKILKTTNAGTNWIVNHIVSNNQLMNMCFLNSNTGWIGGDHLIKKTTDGGMNWNTQFYNTSYWVHSLDFVNPNTGWASATPQTLLYTSDGGNTWISNNCSYTYPDYVHFFDANTGVMMSGTFGIVRTTNSGVFWQPVSTISPVSGSCDNSNNLYASEIHSFYKSTDMGQTWNLIADSLPSLWPFQMVNPMIGYAGGLYGEIVKTTNGGLNWNRQNSKFDQQLRSIFFINENSGWAVGNNGAILSTVDGGGNFVNLKPDFKEIPEIFSLSQNYPNPFNPVTRIKYDIPPSKGARGMITRLIIYDILGREVETLVNESKKPGSYEVTWDGSRHASGVYFYRLITDEFVETKKMVLIK